MTADYASDSTDTDRLLDFDLDNMQYQADRPKQYAAGRRCCHDGCKTILNTYNGGETCDLHKAAPDFMVYLGRRFKVCDTCGRLDFERAFRRLTPDEYATTCLRCEAELRGRSERTKELLKRDDYHLCDKCGRALPANSNHWRMYTKRNGTTRPRGYCRLCRADNDSDKYHQQRYGMTRAEYRGTS